MQGEEINQDRSKPSYQKLNTMVKRRMDQMIRTRNFQARNERIETGVLRHRRPLLLWRSTMAHTGAASALAGGFRAPRDL